MYFPMELKHNPAEKDDIDAESERREEILGELQVLSQSQGNICP